MSLKNPFDGSGLFLESQRYLTGIIPFSSHTHVSSTTNPFKTAVECFQLPLTDISGSNNWEICCSFSFVPFLPRNEVLSRPSTRKHLHLFSKDSSHLSREIFLKVNGLFCNLNAVYTTFKCQQQFGIPIFSIGTTLVPCCSWNSACTGAMHALRLAATSETVLPNPKIWRALAVHPS